MAKARDFAAMTLDRSESGSTRGTPSPSISRRQVHISALDYFTLVESWTSRVRRRTEFPRKLKPPLVALHYVLQGLEPWVSYTEGRGVESCRARQHPAA